MEQNIYVAVDLGANKIRMMAATRNNEDKLHIISFEQDQPQSNSIKNGAIHNVENVAWHINDLAKKTTNRMDGLKEEVDSVYLPINGRTLRTQHYRADRRFSAATKITRNDLNSLRQEALNQQQEGKTIISVSCEECLVDGEITHNPEGAVCQHIEMNYLIAYAAESIQQNIADCMQSITINGKGNIPAPAAIAMAVTSDEERKEGCAVINFGSETTTLAVFESGYLRHMAVIPFGGKHITSDLMHLNLTQEEADTLKRKFGSPIIRDTEEKLNIKGRAGSNDKHVQLKQVYSIIEARMSEIVTLCMGEIEVSGYLDKLPRGIIATGGGTMIKDFFGFMKQKTGMDVRPGSHTANLDEESAMRYSNTEYALLIGTLMQATEPCTHNTSERPATGNEKKKGGFFTKKMEKVLVLFGGNENAIEDEEAENTSK